MTKKVLIRVFVTLFLPFSGTFAEIHNRESIRCFYPLLPAPISCSKRLPLRHAQLAKCHRFINIRRPRFDFYISNVLISNGECITFDDFDMPFVPQWKRSQCRSPWDFTVLRSGCVFRKSKNVRKWKYVHGACTLYYREVHVNSLYNHRAGVLQDSVWFRRLASVGDSLRRRGCNVKGLRETRAPRKR